MFRLQVFNPNNGSIEAPNGDGIDVRHFLARFAPF